MAQLTADIGATIAQDPQLAELVKRLVAAYSPERVFLFGSRARGEAGADSDKTMTRTDGKPWGGSQSPMPAASPFPNLRAHRGGLGHGWTQPGRDLERTLADVAEGGTQPEVVRLGGC